MQKYRVTITPKAEQDILDIYAYIARDSLYYGEKVRQTITNWCRDVLSVAPQIGHMIDDAGTREITEPQYRYVIRFVLRETTVYILMVYKWQLRD